MKSLIVDDHKINYVLIKNLLNESFPEFAVIDSAESVSQALKMLESNNYDLIFLDMKLGDGEGFDVLREMTEFTFVIVVSSHKEYAIDAFKHNVVDYLVKPVKADEFRNAVTKMLNLYARLALDQAASSTSIRPALPESSKILINHRNDYIALDKKSVLFIRAQGKYSEIHTDKGDMYLSSKNLKEFEDTMAGIMFRVHRSYLVNVEAITSLSKDDSTVTLSSSVVIPVSVRKQDDLFRTFRIF